MAKLKRPELDPTLAKAAELFAAFRNGQESKPRQYLGCSGIGHDCGRKLWLTLRATKGEPIEAKGWSAIDDGHRGEDIIVERLQRVPGLEFHAVDANGQQFAVEACNGHVRGHLDGAVRGLLQAPKTWHVFEAKVCNVKKFEKLIKLAHDEGEKNALEQWDPIYYAQAQMYMGLTGMDRHWLVCATPGVRDWFSVRTEFDKAFFGNLINHADSIIEADEPPPKWSDDPANWICKWCDFSKYCHGKKIPPPNCRNCMHSTPATSVLDGVPLWTCEKFGKEATDPCEHHVYIPQLVPYAEVKDMDAGKNVVEYELEDGRTFKNGTRTPHSTIYTSEELCETEPALIQDATVDTLRVEFGATIEDSAGLPRVNTDKPPMDWEGQGDDIPF